MTAVTDLKQQLNISDDTDDALLARIVTNNITVEGSAGTPEQNNDLSRQMARQLEALCAAL